MSSILEDKDSKPSFVIEHAVSVLGITHEPDTDNDGISDRIENAAPQNGDGNQDGTADALQSNVASLPNAVDDRYVTLCVGSCNEPSNRGTLSSVASLQRDVPIVGLNVPVGVFSFEVNGLGRGEAARVELLLPDGVNADAYYKIDPDTGTWKLFSFDSGFFTGANVFNNHIELRLEDGWWGDHDGELNGTIVDPGVPVYFDNHLPVIDMLEDQTINEGDTATATFNITDPEGDPFTVAASIGTITQNPDSTYTWEFPSTDGPADSQLVVISASDGHPVTANRAFDLTVNNIAPTAIFANTSGIVKATDPATVLISDAVDPSPVDTAAGFLYSVDCESDGIWEVVQGADPSFDCTYPKMGIYTATGRIEDKDGGYTDYTTEVEVRLKLITPAPSYALCSLDPQSVPISVIGLTDQQLRGQVIAQYVTGIAGPDSREVIDGGFYPVDHKGPDDFSLNVNYPGLWDWKYFKIPLYPGAIGALFIDIQIEVLDADGNFIRNEDGSVYTLGPGDAWGVWCSKIIVMDTQQPSVMVSEGSPAVMLGRISNAATYTASIGTVADHNDGTWEWHYTPDDGPIQSQLVTVSACDSEFGGNDCSEVSFDLIVENIAPTGTLIATPDYLHPGSNSTLAFSNVFDLSSADTSAGFLYSFDCTGDGVFEVVDSSNSSLACEYSTAGDYSASGRVKDKDGGFTDYNVLVIVNTEPVLTLDAQSVEVDEGISAILTGLVTDADGNTITLTSSIGSITLNPDGTFVWTYPTTDGPSERQTVTITADDGHRGVVSEAFDLTVDNVPPSAMFAPQVNPVSVGFSAPLEFTSPADSSPVDATAGFLYSYDCTNDGSFELTDSTADSFPCPYNQVGSYTAAGRIKDKDGGATDYTAAITVTNQPPLVTIPLALVTVNEGDVAMNVGTANDPDGHTLILSASAGNVTLNPDGTFNWSFQTSDGPSESQMVTITADDNYGGVTSQTFQLVVNNVAPMASFINQTGDVTINGSGVLAFINPVDPGLGDTSAGFSYSFDCTGDGVYEAVNSTASTYACAYNQLGSFNAQGRIQDRDGAYADYAIPVNVIPPMPQPDLSVTVTAPASATLGETVAYMVTVTNLSSSNATNVVLTDNVPPGLAIQSVIPVQGVCDNTVTCQMGTLAGNGVITVQINAVVTTTGSINNTVGVLSDQPDPNPSNNNSNIVLQAQSNNLPPIATDDVGETIDAVPLTMDVLANDSDPNGDPLAVIEVSSASSGIVQINPDQTIQFIPDASFTGTVTFTYHISDGKGGTALAQGHVNVGLSK
ncbi:MAG: Ig-like domain-containing protein [Anaerolineae bacterium]